MKAEISNDPMRCCGRCGAALTAEAPRGLCPACLVQLGQGVLFADESGPAAEHDLTSIASLDPGQKLPTSGPLPDPAEVAEVNPGSAKIPPRASHDFST